MRKFFTCSVGKPGADYTEANLDFEPSMVALVYPGEELKISGSYFTKEKNQELDNKHCHIVQIPADNDFKAWKKRILERVIESIV